jgi:hypothetical protein
LKDLLTFCIAGHCTDRKARIALSLFSLVPFDLICIASINRLQVGFKTSQTGGTEGRYDTVVQLTDAYSRYYAC